MSDKELKRDKMNDAGLDPESAQTDPENISQCTCGSRLFIDQGHRVLSLQHPGAVVAEPVYTCANQACNAKYKIIRGKAMLHK